VPEPACAAGRTDCSRRRRRLLAPDPVETAIARMDAALVAGDEVPTDRELAGELEIPERRLRDLFRRSLGVTPRAWVPARRAELLRSRLAGGQGVTPALYDAGYGSSSAAYEAANGELGMAPGRYRTGAAGESIRWTIAPIPEGVAARGHGPRPVQRPIRPRAGDAGIGTAAEFPRAALARDDAALSDVASIVSDLAIGRRRPEADTLPLDVHATAFRRRVWEALRRIPFGETRSYGQIAAAVGAPGAAARAVGTACAENPVPVVVPCHRVVGSDGSLHGYAYGLARKRQLLDAEARPRLRTC
jgi:AraC family transcriptional regulator of adaptative response/methylated-DNA-[protein]-cysteine methyltransferase